MDKLLMNKFTFRKIATLKMKKKYFRMIKKNADNNKAFRLGMKKLLKNRAHNIMKIAYVKGLKRVWHSVNI